MHTENGFLESASLVSLLKDCAKNRNLQRGATLHVDIFKKGLFGKDFFVASALINMYVKCGVLRTAEEVFEELPVRNVVLWNALITGYVQWQHSKGVFESFEQLQCEGLYPDVVTFICTLKACGCQSRLDKGKLIHLEIVKQDLLGKHVALGNAVVDMYVKCGILAKAREVLEGLLVRDVVSWNILISGYMQVEDGEEALYCFQKMHHEGIVPDVITFICILKACGCCAALDMGEFVHSDISRQGWLYENLALGCALVNMYSKCNELVKAKEVLEELLIRDVVSWNALISGYVQGDYGQEALNCFKQLLHEALSPTSVTYTLVLRAFGNLGALLEGENMQSEIMRQGLMGENVGIGNALVDMYAKCGALAKAKEVLGGLFIRDLVSWSALIVGYLQEEQGKEALGCFEQMRDEGIEPDAITFACILKACGSIGALNKGKTMHSEIIRHGLLRENVVLGSALVDMYAKCGDLANAKEVFERLTVRDAVSWSALITGYAQGEYGSHALKCFEQMQCEGLSPDVITFISILKACGSARALNEGRNIHSEVVRQSLIGGTVVLGGALVDMYAKCGALAKAKEVLEGLPVRNALCWNAMIAGYAHAEFSAEALVCFERMLCEGFFPDGVTFACIWKAYGCVGAIESSESYILRC